MRIFLGFLLLLGVLSIVADAREETGLVFSRYTVSTLGMHRCLYTIELADVLWITEGCGASLETGSKYTFIKNAKSIGWRDAKGKIHWLKIFGTTMRPKDPVPVVVVK